MMMMYLSDGCSLSLPSYSLFLLSFFLSFVGSEVGGTEEEKEKRLPPPSPSSFHHRASQKKEQERGEEGEEGEGERRMITDPLEWLGTSSPS